MNSSPIRPFAPRDWPGIWTILEPVFRAGETYCVDRDITEEDARRMWIEKPEATFVVPGEGESILGTYFIKPNQAGPGAHVCNCGYVVGEAARGMGLATAMCLHSQTEALERGLRGMQYNFVVSTNTGAVRLWEKHGFDVVGTLPGAFHHPTEGYVDAFVMYKQLAS